VSVKHVREGLRFVTGLDYPWWGREPLRQRPNGRDSGVLPAWGKFPIRTLNKRIESGAATPSSAVSEVVVATGRDVF